MNQEYFQLKKQAQTTVDKKERKRLKDLMEKAFEKWDRDRFRTDPLEFFLFAFLPSIILAVLLVLAELK